MLKQSNNRNRQSDVRFFPDGKADFGEKILARSDPGAKRKFYAAFYQTLKDFVSGSTDPVHR